MAGLSRIDCKYFVMRDYDDDLIAYINNKAKTEDIILSCEDCMRYVCKLDFDDYDDFSYYGKYHCELNEFDAREMQELDRLL